MKNTNKILETLNDCIEKGQDADLDKFINLINKLKPAINYAHCCKSDSEQLCKCKKPCGTYEGVVVDKDYCRLCNNLIA